jgi:hypothetical protein
MNVPLVRSLILIPVSHMSNVMPKESVGDTISTAKENIPRMLSILVIYE